MPSIARVVFAKMSWLVVKRVPEVYPVGTPSKIGTPAMFVLCARTTGGPLLLVARVVPPDPKLVGPEIPL